MATEPDINVYEQPLTIQDNNTSRAGNIAVIGAFNSTITNLTLVTGVKNAHNLFGTSTTYGTFKGTDVIDELFTGASSLLIANITTYTTGDNPTAETTLTNQKLTDALSKLHNEEFDMLFIAEELTDAQQTIVTKWLDDEFENKYCHGQIIQIRKSTASAYETSIATVNNNVFYINTQELTVYGKALDLNRSTAYIAGLIAKKDINESLTTQNIPGVTAVSPEYTTETGDLGASLLTLNIPFIKCRNRRTNNYVCVNSQLPDGHDLYIYRARDYILNRIAVETYFGKISNDETIEGITNIVENIRKNVIDMKFCKDIIYSVERESSKCVNILIDRIIFDDVITQLNIYYSIEVQ